MPDTLTKAQRSAVMRRVRSKDTAPEMAVRRALHKQGVRFRLHQATLPGSPDLVLPKYRTAVFVNGCLWHWHGCSNSRMPGSNVDYWERKIARTVARDQTHRDILETMGWRVTIIWECAIEDGINELVQALDKASH